MRALWLLLPVLAGCSHDEEITQIVLDSFAEANPQGTFGAEVGGKGIWFTAPFFDGDCLTARDLAHQDLPEMRPANARETLRISPRYESQQWWTTSTPRGWCVFLGRDPSIEVTGIQKAGPLYQVSTEITVQDPSPYWQCMADWAVHRTVDLEHRDGTFELQTDMGLFQGDCPVPLNTDGLERVSVARPTAAPPSPPTAAQVASLAREFDAKLLAQDYLGARDLVYCYNVYAEEHFGTCSVSDFIALGPQFDTNTGPQHGVPWLEYAVRSPDEFKRIRVDRDDPTMYHVSLTHRRSNRPRTFAVQWVGGEWKLVGVVGLMAEGLTSARFLYDLDKRDRREVLERRLQGEAIDENGNPLDPYADLVVQ